MKNVTRFWRIAILSAVLLAVAGVVVYRVVASTGPFACPLSAARYVGCLPKGDVDKQCNLKGDYHKHCPLKDDCDKECPHKGDSTKEGQEGQLDKEGCKGHAPVSHHACRGCCCKHL